MATLNPGQSVVLTAHPTIATVQGGTLPPPGIITWTNNAMNNGQNVTMMSDNNTCTISAPIGCPGGSFTVTATCGTLTANHIIIVNAPALADGIIIVPGTVQ